MSQAITQEFLKLRDRYIEAQFSKMNPMQRKAVLSVNGPLLILAGAGSGKTTVLVNRIANIIDFGSAWGSENLYHQPTQEDLDTLHSCVVKGEKVPESLMPLMRWENARPWNVLAITFTNKAAQELKERIGKMLGPELGQDVNASTFHSACVRILRRDGECLGYPRSFTIYDTDDQKRVYKEIYKELEIDEKFLPMKSAMSQIGRYKDQMVSPQSARELAGDVRSRQVARIYESYQTRLKKAGAMDFDDLIYNTVRLLADHQEVREYYQNKFKYVLVDEYQDTSVAQFQLVRLLCSGTGNICVVGDDDQSIYRFRGATIENILSFEQQFPGALVIRLEQNYRSTSHILDAANEVIQNNEGRKGKTLWTDLGQGEKVEYYQADSEQMEAIHIAEVIGKNLKMGMKLRDHAVLYRMNAQSGPIETYFARAGIPYRIVGGQRFYDRKEVKDILSYMAIVANPQDDLRLRRIINEPARKIGAATVDRMGDLAAQQGISMLEVCRHAQEYAALSRAAGALGGFIKIYDQLEDTAQEKPLDEFVRDLLDITGYRQMLKGQGEEGETRLENLGQLVNSVKTYCDQQGAQASLEGFLEEVALISDIDSYDENADSVVMMTLHSAKGLEFPQVFIVGMEEGVFPGEMSRYTQEDLEEERRLCYVGITRAKKKLCLISSRSRMLFGRTQYNQPSRFLGEIDPEHLEMTGNVMGQGASQNGYGSYGGYHVPGGRSGYSGASYGQSVGYGGYSGYSGYSAQRSDTASGYGGYGGHSGKSAPIRTGGYSAGVSTVQEKPAPLKGDKPQYKPGQWVEHKTLGRGQVLSVKPTGGDCIVEVRFDRVGVKKTMANYAPMKPVEE